MSTPEATPALPDWARDVLDTFARLSGQSHGHLTQTELRLFDAAWLLLRARFGETELLDPENIVRMLVRGVLDDLDAEEAQR